MGEDLIGEVDSRRAQLLGIAFGLGARELVIVGGADYLFRPVWTWFLSDFPGDERLLNNFQYASQVWICPQLPIVSSDEG